MLEIKKCEKRPRVRYEPHPKFGSIFAPHLLRMDFTADKMTNLKAEITPFQPELFSPGSSVLHYGQSVFEGLKVYRQKDGGIAAFRADLHATRLVKSAKRLAMPAINEEIFMECLLAYMKQEEESVPSEPDHSLYIRPLLIARDEIIKIGKSKAYTFFIMSAIAGSYFKGAAIAATVLVNREFVRAFPGGLGEVKTAANYASSLMAQSYAEGYKCDQVLYLDALKHEYCDELGGMNFFCVRDGRELVTPPLTGTILDGITRRSILEIATSLGLKGCEEPIPFTQLCKDITAGRVTETFACGTAAVVHSIGEFVVQEKTGGPATSIKLNTSHPVASKLREHISALQRGAIKAPGEWLFRP